MKNRLLILLLFLSFFVGFSQTSIELKTVPIKIQHQNFYVQKVNDKRQENSLGIVKDGYGKEVSLQLEGGVSKAVKDFMDFALPKSDDRIPILIEIGQLKIEQVQTGIDEITARVYTELFFFTENGIECYKIGHYEDQIYHTSDLVEIYKTHEQRIRAALEYCLLSFINYKKVDSKAYSLVEDSKSGIPSTSVHNLEPYDPLGKWFNILTFKKRFDRHHEGWEVAYAGFADSEKDFIIPFEIAYGQSKAKTDVVRDRGYNSVNSYTLGLGFNGYIKIVPGLYADIGLNMPIGLETLRDLENNKSNSFLIGIGAHQGVKIIPWKEFGIVIGAGIFQQRQTSKVYKRNFGFELEVGINF